jgi:hypothetical protein
VGKDTRMVGSDGVGSFKTRPRVTDVEVVMFDEWEDADRPRWGAHVYPVSHGLPLAELLIDSSMDVEEWCDRTGFDWSPEVRAQLVAQLPGASAVPKFKVELHPDLHISRERAIAVLTESNNPPVFFRRGGLVTEIKRNERGVPSAQRIEATRMRDRLADVAQW